MDATASTSSADQAEDHDSNTFRMSRAPRLPQSGDGPLTNEAFEHAIGLLMDKVDAIHGDQAAAMAQAITQVATSPEVIRQVIDRVAEAAQERATKAAGQGVWWLVKNVLAKWVVIGAIVVMAAKVLGWDLATKLGKWLVGTAA